MKALILSCNTGGGHNSVAKAVQEAIIQNGGSCCTIDALSFFSRRASKFISSCHTRLYRSHARVFNSGYGYAEKRRSSTSTRFNRLLGPAAKRLNEYVELNEFDCLICPHVFSGMLVTELLNAYLYPNIKTCFIATDYTCSPLAEKCLCDLYFVPSEAVADEFKAVGISEDRLVCTGGIPVKSEFYQTPSKAREKLAHGIPPTVPHALIMFGSMGCGPINELTDNIAACMPEKAHVTVICGTNRRLYRRLSRKWADFPRIHICKYAKNVSALMDSADLFITKPGGISTAEAAAKGLPMLFLNAVPGIEKYNLFHFCGTGGAIAAEDAASAAELCTALLKDGEKLKEMSACIKSTCMPAQKIYASLQTLFIREASE